MPGYPNLPNRAAFGPSVLENVRPVQNPKRELSAEQMMLTFWQMAGAGRMLPQFITVLDGAQVTPVTEFQAKAFDPRGELPNIEPVDNGVGDYTWTFDTTYKDENGQDTLFSPKGAMAFVQGGAARDEAGATVVGQTVQVEVRDSANAAKDAKVLLLVW